MENEKLTTVQDLRNAASPKTEDNINYVKRLGYLMAKNYRSVYEDTEQDKDIIFSHISSKINHIKNSDNIVYETGKKLVYFSIFTNEYFIQMLDICLKSIISNTKNIDFDVLFITDEDTKNKIEKLNSIKNFNIKYLILDTPPNGIDASFNKLQIINFSEINNYEKILYLDVDIICIKDVNLIFDLPLVVGILHVRKNKSDYIRSYFTIPTNGLMYLSENMARFILDNTNISPFNAGQFVFKNCSHIQKHIKNTLWLSEVWPGIHFFEQSFMNSYFCLHGLTEQYMLDSMVEIVSSPIESPSNSTGSLSSVETKNTNISSHQSKKSLIVLNAVKSKFAVDALSDPKITGKSGDVRSKEYELSFVETLKTAYTDLKPKHTEKTVLIHFAGWSINGRQKIHFIETYCNVNGIIYNLN